MSPPQRCVRGARAGGTPASARRQSAAGDSGAGAYPPSFPPGFGDCGIVRFVNALPPHPPIDVLRTPRNEPAWRTVIVGGRVAARLLAASAHHLGLEPGLPWSPELAARALHQGALDRCRAHAIAVLAPRALSRAELAGRLASRGHAPRVIEPTLERLAHDRLIDDEAFARAIVESSDTHRPAGAALLRHRLLKRGVPEPLVERILSARSSNPIDDALRALADTSRPADADLPPAARARRYLTRLARRGFDEDVAREAVARLVPEARSDDA